MRVRPGYKQLVLTQKLVSYPGSLISGNAKKNYTVNIY